MRKISSLDLRIRMGDLKDVTTGLEPGFLTRCLNEFVNQAYDEAVAEVAAKCFGNDSKATEKAARAVQTAFCSMARQDDRGNWARRSVSAKWVAELLDDIEPDPDANRKAADDVLRIFHKHGYLNRSVVRQGEEYDVSHEALIRNWTKYDVWLRELGAISSSVREVVDDLESRKQVDASVQAQRSPGTVLAKPLRMLKQFWDRILDWLLERKEKQATALITDQHRDNLGKVVGAERTVSVGLAAALLADSERRKSARLTGSSIILDEPTASDLQQRSQLEIRMRERIEEIEPDWSLADVASKRVMPRLIIVPGVLGIIVLAVVGVLMSSILKNMELTRSQNRLYFGAVAAAGNLDVPRWLEASAFELERVYNRIAEHRSEENWANNPSALGEMSLSMSNWERAARQLTGAIVIRDPTDAPAEIPKANCSISGTELLRRVGAISFGVTFDGAKKSWWPRIKTASRTDTALAPDARLYPLAKEGDMVCLSRNIPLVLVWPAGKEEEPQFWMLRLRCQTFVGSTCATWLSEPLRMRVLFSKNYASVQGEPPWRKLWQSKMERGVGASLWENMDVYDFSSAVHNAPPRTGFAFKFDDEWLIADMTPGVNSPYILSMSSDMQHVCADEDCVFDMKFSKLRIKNGPKFKDSAGKCTGGGNCPVVLDVLAVPSEGNEFLPIWGWTLPGASIDVIATDGKIMDFHDMDGLWRRSVIGVQTLAEHVKILAGSMSDEPLKVKLDVLDLSDACQKTKCQDWKPVEESAAKSWQW